MGSFSDALWRPDPATYGPRRSRRPCRYSPYTPDLLAAMPLDLPAAVTADVSDAERALVRLGQDERAPDLEALARFLLRAEAIASSKIEGLVVNTRRLARHEAKVAAGIRDPDATADAVLGNVVAMQVAVDRVARSPHVDLQSILDIHRALMSHSASPEIAGVLRHRQNWIGGSDLTPCGADFVPPPPEVVSDLLADLCSFIDDDRTSPVVQAAVVHAQFETIHPFADGNGRTGRALIHVVLKRRGLTPGVVPPISLVLATRSKDYVAGLTAYRYDGAPEGLAAAAAVADWVETFASAAQRAARDAMDLARLVAGVENRWRERVRPRRGSATDRLLRQLIAAPVIGAEDVGRLTGASRAASFTAVDTLVRAGVLHQVGSAARNRLFEAPDVFAALTGYERALATESGDTRQEKPARPTPARMAESSH
jgi:Fic family protein